MERRSPGVHSAPHANNRRAFLSDWPQARSAGSVADIQSRLRGAPAPFVPDAQIEAAMRARYSIVVSCGLLLSACASGGGGSNLDNYGGGGGPIIGSGTGG